jgi:aryl-alcohol dehydrogenase-like predicted oxidoreductase
MKENGMFRYLGVNTHEESVMNYISKRPELFDMVLLDYNVLQLDREPIINKLHKSGIGVLAGTVLAQGHLVKGKIE